MFRPILICLLALLSCTKDPDPVVTIPDPPQEKPSDTGGNNGNNDTSMPTEIKITVSGKSLPVKIEDNAATKALVAALRESSITYEADDYGGFEKVGALGRSLPTSNSHAARRRDPVQRQPDRAVLRKQFLELYPDRQDGIWDVG